MTGEMTTGEALRTAVETAALGADHYRKLSRAALADGIDPALSVEDREAWRSISTAAMQAAYRQAFAEIDAAGSGRSMSIALPAVAAAVPAFTTPTHYGYACAAVGTSIPQ